MSLSHAAQGVFQSQRYQFCHDPDGVEPTIGPRLLGKLGKYASPPTVKSAWTAAQTKPDAGPGTRGPSTVKSWATAETKPHAEPGARTDRPAAPPTVKARVSAETKPHTEPGARTDRPAFPPSFKSVSAAESEPHPEPDARADCPDVEASNESCDEPGADQHVQDAEDRHQAEVRDEPFHDAFSHASRMNCSMPQRTGIKQRSGYAFSQPQPDSRTERPAVEASADSCGEPDADQRVKDAEERHQAEVRALTSKLMDAREQAERLKTTQKHYFADISAEREQFKKLMEKCRSHEQDFVKLKNQKSKENAELGARNVELERKLARLRNSQSTSSWSLQKMKTGTDNNPLAKHMAGMECRPLKHCAVEEKATLKKKLLLKWHPDKQPSYDHSAFATRVMQEMQNCAEWAD